MLAARDLIAEDEQAGQLFFGNSEGPKIGARVGRKGERKFGELLSAFFVRLVGNLY